MSAHQLRDPAFLDLVEEAVADLGENRLLLEMTETVFVTADDETDCALRTLTSLGAQLAIDDFGVGFSSIGYLQNLPVDVLKIDRSFLRDIDVSPRAAALVDAIIVMGAALDLRVVAEGIERPRAGRPAPPRRLHGRAGLPVRGPAPGRRGGAGAAGGAAGRGTPRPVPGHRLTAAPTALVRMPTRRGWAGLPAWATVGYLR